MKKIAKSPDRNTFQKNNYLERCKKEGKEPSQDYLDMWDNWKQKDNDNLVNPEWQKNNMEFDMRSCDWICKKVKESENYAQNLYAAMCNNEFQKLEVIPILKEERWSASWRYSGGIIADMREEGDYIDWYCSGIGSTEEGYGLDGHQPTLDEDGRTYVSESVITDEIREDLKKLGWIPVDCEED